MVWDGRSSTLRNEMALGVNSVEIQRKAAFRANPMAESFLSVMLQDMQYSEGDEACTEEREARDVGTIYDCPDSTFRAALAECEAFKAAILAHDYLGHIWQGFDLRDSILEQLGSDLYLERAGHGAGFRDRDVWDLDENDRVAEALSSLVDSGLETYLGDDGKAYICGKEA